MGVLVPAVPRLRSAMLDGFRFACIALAATEGVSFATDALTQLFELLDRAELSENMSAEDLLAAQIALVRIVHEAAVTAQSRGQPEISASTFRGILAALCPLPPWIQRPC